MIMGKKKEPHLHTTPDSPQGEFLIRKLAKSIRPVLRLR